MRTASVHLKNKKIFIVYLCTPPFVGQRSGNKAVMETCRKRMVIAECECVSARAAQLRTHTHFSGPLSTGPSDSSQPDLEAVGAAALESWRPALFIQLCHTHTHKLWFSPLLPLGFYEAGGHHNEFVWWCFDWSSWQFVMFEAQFLVMPCWGMCSHLHKVSSDFVGGLVCVLWNDMKGKSSSASWAGYPTGGLWTTSGSPPLLFLLWKSNLSRDDMKAQERSTVTWREKSRGKKRGRKAVPSHPQARREGNGKLLLTHFIWQLVSCLWISLTRCQATGAKFRRLHSCCSQRKEAARQKGPTWLVLYGPLLRPAAPVPLSGARHHCSHIGSLPWHVPVVYIKGWTLYFRLFSFLDHCVVAVTIFKVWKIPSKIFQSTRQWPVNVIVCNKLIRNERHWVIQSFNVVKNSIASPS